MAASGNMVAGVIRIRAGIFNMELNFTLCPSLYKSMFSSFDIVPRHVAFLVTIFTWKLATVFVIVLYKTNVETDHVAPR